MLRSLKLVGIGPAPKLDLELGPRLNVLTGDNGLGKSFLLDVIWWSLSGTWAARPAWPAPNTAKSSIEIALDEATATATNAFAKGYTYTDRRIEAGRYYRTSDFDRRAQQWDPPSFASTEAPLPALIVYARVDGTLALWDPARNHHKLRQQPRWGASDLETDADPSAVRRPPAYIFNQDEILNGKELRGKTLCNGLIADWGTWSLMRPGSPGNRAFQHLCNVLEKLSPNPDDEEPEIIRPGTPQRLFVDDAREFPTTDTGHGDVPIIHASAAMTRIISLAYFLVWAWHEHVEASRLLDTEPVKNIVFLMDEIEIHLHPEWQRRIVRALLGVLEDLAEGMQVQAHFTTHSPLVLASLEPIFDPAKDKLFVLDVEDHRVVLRDEPFIPRGDASRWLTSRAFNLHIARSIEAQRAMEDASALMRGEPPHFYTTREEVDRALHAVLPGQDAFWPRWLAFIEGAST